MQIKYVDSNNYINNALHNSFMAVCLVDQSNPFLQS